MKIITRNIWLTIAIALIVLTVPTLAYAANEYGDAGFWEGLWHGVTLPFRLPLKLIWTDITIYNEFDSTYGYHIGYLLGFLAIAGGSRAA